MPPRQASSNFYHDTAPLPTVPTEICPVCKSSLYLNPKLTFLLSPECYHTMCTSCVDRLFTSGPAPCPVAGCHKTLRKRQFRTAFFGDLGVEREVDVRRRVGAVFNRREDEFEGKREWDDYLEMVEDLVFRIVNGDAGEKRKAEEALREYAEHNRREIEENLKAEKEEEELARRQQKDAEDRARARRRAVEERRERDRRDIEQAKRGMIEALAGGYGDAEEITRKAEKLILEKTERLHNEEIFDDGMDKGLTIRGLKKRTAAIPEGPYDPFGGLDLTPRRYVLQKTYPNDDLKFLDSSNQPGGYNLQEYYARSMFEAFAGLGVFIEDEVTNRDSDMAMNVMQTGRAENKTSLDVF
jgi:CDK-activating kinase assembly factor MAT1